MQNKIHASSLSTMLAAICLMFMGGTNLVQAQWTTSGNNISNTNSGNVGIGTTNPDQKLGVQGMVGIYPQPWVLPNQRGMFILHEGTTGSIYAFNYPAGAGDPLAISASNVTFHTYVGWSSYPRVSITNGGNVGIGTTNPQRQLQLHSSANSVFQLTDATSGATSADGLQLIQAGLNSYVENQEAGSLTFRTSATDRVTINSSGSVGIGTTSPLQRLQLGSNTPAPTAAPDAISLGASYSSSARANPKLRLYDDNSSSVYGLGVSDHQFDFMVPVSSRYVWSVNGVEKMRLDDSGNITIAGNINARYQDLAEWVESSQALPAGTVVVLDQTRSNQVVASSQAYDTRVAGVISGQPGIALGESGKGKVLVATTGRVRIKVDASRGPIKIGDLLVTSDVTGVAMKSHAIELSGIQIHRPGTLIGKALEPLEKGTGEILVLLSLQ